jgi:transcriptional regulator with XRE-family HTH domain
MPLEATLARLTRMPKHGGWEHTGFGERLRRLREARGLTQQELADKASCNKFTVAKLERGTQEPAWPLVLAFAAALGVDCTAFTQPPTERDPAGPGRSRIPSVQEKTPVVEEKPSAKGKKKGRKPKTESK